MDESSLLTIPHLKGDCIEALEKAGIKCVPHLIEAVDSKSSWVPDLLVPMIGAQATKQVLQVIWGLCALYLMGYNIDFVSSVEHATDDFPKLSCFFHCLCFFIVIRHSTLNALYILC